MRLRNPSLLLGRVHVNSLLILAYDYDYATCLHFTLHSIIDTATTSALSPPYPAPPQPTVITMATLIKYAPFASDVDMQFYAALAHIKINHDKLDDSARKVLGLYEVRPGDHSSRSMRVQIHPNALTSDECVLHSVPTLKMC